MNGLARVLSRGLHQTSTPSTIPRKRKKSHNDWSCIRGALNTRISYISSGMCAEDTFNDYHKLRASSSASIKGRIKQMAFAIKLTAMKWSEGRYSCIEVPGEISDRHLSSDDSRFRQIALTAGYLDYFAILSPEEAREIARTHYEELPLWPPRPTGQPSLKDEALSKAEDALRDVDFVVAHLFEWESGLG